MSSVNTVIIMVVVLIPNPNGMRADIIIVGSGIHGQSDRVAAAKAYANASWNAILERGK